jgi:hypothetical protein
MPRYLKQTETYWIVEDDQGYGNALCLKTSWTSEYLNLVAKHKIKVIRLNDRIGWPDSDISFLLKIPDIRGVDIISDSVTDVSPIFQLKELRSLSLYCKAKVAGDFGKLKKLENLGLDWQNVYRSAFELDTLRRLNVLHYPDADLSNLSPNVHLKDLFLSSNRLVSLSGIERFPNIERIDIFRCRHMRSLKSIKPARLIRTLTIDQCPNIKDLSPLSYLTELTTLEIENCRDIQSLKPLVRCGKLKRLQIAGNTTVIDGNLSPLMKLSRLKEVLLAKRKHYSHSDEELSRRKP